MDLFKFIMILVMELKKAKLAYYPYPVVLKEASEEIENYFDTTEDKTIGEYYFDIFRLIEAEH